jgi:hypothetical protein
VELIRGGGHDITPRRGSARTADGSPADLRTVPPGSPVTAECAECGRPVRCDRYPGEWYHLKTGES